VVRGKRLPKAALHISILPASCTSHSSHPRSDNNPTGIETSERLKIFHRETGSLRLLISLLNGQGQSLLGTTSLLKMYRPLAFLIPRAIKVNRCINPD
jgi:hypothetical protein